MSGGCARIVTTPTVVVVGWTLESLLNYTVFTPKVTSTITHPFIAADDVIIVGWASSDLEKFTPASAPLLKAVDTATSHHNQSNVSSASTPSGLTAETKGWIALGTIGGVLCLVVFGFLLARARRHHVEEKRKLLHAAEMGGQLGRNKFESDGSAIFEADEECKPAEADPSCIRAELEGNWRGYEVATSMRSPRSDS